MEEYIDVNEVRSMLYIPENAVEIRMEIKVYHDGQLVTVGKTFGLQDIRKAIDDADRNYMEATDRYVLTDLGWSYKTDED